MTPTPPAEGPPLRHTTLVLLLLSSTMALLVLANGAGCVGRGTTPTVSDNERDAVAPQTAATTTTTTATTSATAPPVVSAPGPGRRLLVVYTANVQGYVEPCGCTGDPLGGIARLADVVDDAKAAYDGRVLFVDAGNLLFEHETDTAAIDLCQASARTELLVDTYARLGLAATTTGPLDVVRGAAFRDSLLAKHTIPSLDDGAVRFVDRGDLHLALVGANATLPPATLQQRLDKAIAKEQGDGRAVDLTVLLFQGNAHAANALAADLKGVDLIIVGQAPETPLPPERHGDAVVVSAGWQAQQVGLVDVALPDAGAPKAVLPLDDRQALRESRLKLLGVRIAELEKLLAELEPSAKRDFQQQRRDRFVAERDELLALATTEKPLEGPHLAVRAVPLQRGMGETKAVAEALAAYTKAIPTLVGQCEAGVVCPEPAPGVPRFVGAAVCMGCHQQAHETWQKALVDVESKDTSGAIKTVRSGHAKAWETLVHQGRDRDRSCVGCHSVGFDVDGGACTTTELVKRGLTGVQCESCHGAGSAHVAGGGDATKIQRQVPESRCRSCHVPPHIQKAEDFVYDERVLHILGPGHHARP